MKYLKIKFFLIVLLSFIILSPSFVQAKAKNVDTFDNASSWESIGDTTKISAGKGKKNKSLKLGYDFSEGSEWVVIKKDFPELKLPDNFKFSFYVKGSGQVNNLEFKLTDEAGNNFIKRIASYKFSKKWQKITVKKSGMSYGWGPDQNAVIGNKIHGIEIAVTKAKKANKGEVLIDELKIETISRKIGQMKSGKNILDNCEDPSSWNVLNSENTKLNLDKADGKKGKALKLNFDFPENKGYVLISKNIPILLEGDYEFSFYIKGKAENNNIEFKLIDPKGNTYWKVYSDYSFPTSWKKIIIKSSDITYAWGPDKDSKPKNIRGIEIAISCGKGGNGKIYIDEISLKK